MAMQHAARERNAAPGPQPAYADTPAAPVSPPQADAPVAPAGHSNRVIDAWKSQRALAPQN
jgi:hypothetical protein